MSVWTVVVATLAGFGLCATALAQPPDSGQDDTVQWSAHLSGSSTSVPGGVASIIVEGAIAAGWHVYALEQQPGGPTPLRVTLADSPLASAAGVPSGSKPTRVFDKRFGLNTQLYSGTLTVQLPVHLADEGGSGQLTVNVRFQSCSEQECRPPRTVHLPVPAEVSAHE